MTVAEIFDRAARSPLLHDPFVQRIWNLVQDDQLFKKSPNQLDEIRRLNRRESLSFFARHSPFYAALFERLEIEPKSASVDDLAKLSVPSDLLRGEGQKPFLIEDVESEGESFQSSGTTGKAPVKLYRSPLDLAIK